MGLDAKGGSGRGLELGDPAADGGGFLECALEIFMHGWDVSINIHHRVCQVTSRAVSESSDECASEISHAKL